MTRSDRSRVHVAPTALLVCVLATTAFADDAAIARARDIGRAGPEAARMAIAELINIGRRTSRERLAARDALVIAGPKAVARLIEEAATDASLKPLLLGVSHDLGAAISDVALSGLDSTDPRVQTNAAASLGAAGTAGIPVIERLVRALNDPDLQVRREAALALGSLGRRACDSVPELITLIDDVGRGASHDAILALGMIVRDVAEQQRQPVTPPPEIAQAIDAGLKWLERHQEPDGRWDAVHFDHDGRCGGKGGPGNDIELTALGLVAMLDSGTQQQHSHAVRSAWMYLVCAQRDDGMVGEHRQHGVATAALCTAARVLHEPECAAAAQRALHALKTAKEPWGVVATLQGVFAGLETGRATVDDLELSLGYLGVRLGGGASAPPSVDDDGTGFDPARWALVARMIRHVGGDIERTWSDALKHVVLPRQHLEGCRAGSWDPSGPTRATGGRVQATAAVILSLEEVAGLSRPLLLSTGDTPQLAAALARLQKAAQSPATAKIASRALGGLRWPDPDKPPSSPQDTGRR